MTKNENGVYTDYQTEVIASRGRAFASVDIAKCDDGLYRFATDLRYSYGGYGGPMTDHGQGFQTYQEAKAAGIAHLLERWPAPYRSYPDSVKAELADLRQQIERQLMQPSLF